MKRVNGLNYRTTREQYKTAKKYDHTQFDIFCTSIYKSGFEDGKEASRGLTMDEIMEVIGAVKGIGEKRLSVIRSGILDRMGEDDVADKE